MKQTTLYSISQEIYRRFPEIKGISPKVHARPTPQAKSVAASPTYLLTYNNRGSTPENKSLPRWVRVVVNEQGKILKITTSR